MSFFSLVEITQSIAKESSFSEDLIVAVIGSIIGGGLAIYGSVLVYRRQTAREDKLDKKTQEDDFNNRLIYLQLICTESVNQFRKQINALHSYSLALIPSSGQQPTFDMQNLSELKRLSNIQDHEGLNRIYQWKFTGIEPRMEFQKILQTSDFILMSNQITMDFISRHADWMAQQKTAYIEGYNKMTDEILSYSTKKGLSDDRDQKADEWRRAYNLDLSKPREESLNFSDNHDEFVIKYKMDFYVWSSTDTDCLKISQTMNLLCQIFDGMKQSLSDLKSSLEREVKQFNKCKDDFVNYSQRIRAQDFN